jgi:hypothetical protein
MTRIASLLEDDNVDAWALMNEVHEVARDLQEAIQARIASRFLLYPRTPG